MYSGKLIFAQLTFRESLRDIESCLRSLWNKLYHLGIRCKVFRSTIADANQKRDWRIYAEFAQKLIHQARVLYRDDDFGLELSDMVYTLDSTTIDLCLSVFPWAIFRASKGAVKLNTLLDLRGSIPSFIWITHGKFHDVNILDELIPEPGAIYLMDRAYIDFARLYIFHRSQAFFIKALAISSISISARESSSMFFFCCLNVVWNLQRHGFSGSVFSNKHTYLLFVYLKACVT